MLPENKLQSFTGAERNGERIVIEKEPLERIVQKTEDKSDSQKQSQQSGGEREGSSVKENSFTARVRRQTQTEAQGVARASSDHWGRSGTRGGPGVV